MNPDVFLLKNNIITRWLNENIPIHYSIPHTEYEKYYTELTNHISNLKSENNSTSLDNNIFYFVSVGHGYFELLFLIDFWAAGNSNIIVHIDEIYLDKEFISDLNCLHVNGIISEYWINEEINEHLSQNIPILMSGIQVQLPNSEFTSEQRKTRIEQIKRLPDSEQYLWGNILHSNIHAIQQIERFRTLGVANTTKTVFFMPHGPVSMEQLTLQRLYSSYCLS